MFRHFALFTALFLLLSGCGSGESRNLINDPSFELMGLSSGQPEGWTLVVKSGEYRTAGTAKAYLGESSLAIAGAGGKAELRSNMFELTSGQALEVSFWSSTDLQSDKLEGTVGIVTLSEHSNSSVSPIAKIEPTSEEWRRTRFVYADRSVTVDSKCQLSFELKGDGLLRIDGIEARPLKFDPDYFLPDGGFEHPSDDGGYLKWKTNSDLQSVKATCQKDGAHSGNGSVRLSGNGGWGVYMSEIKFPVSTRLIVQGFVRVHEGKANLKLEYSKEDGTYLGGSYSTDIEGNRWQYVSVELDPELASQADAVAISLCVASDTGKYSADFDDVSVYVCSKRASD